jgi:hypothetical protein
MPRVKNPAAQRNRLATGLSQSANNTTRKAANIEYAHQLLNSIEDFYFLKSTPGAGAAAPPPPPPGGGAAAPPPPPPGGGTPAPPPPPPGGGAAARPTPGGNPMNALRAALERRGKVQAVELNPAAQAAVNAAAADQAAAAEKKRKENAAAQRRAQDAAAAAAANPQLQAQRAAFGQGLAAALKGRRIEGGKSRKSRKSHRKSRKSQRR